MDGVTQRSLMLYTGGMELHELFEHLSEKGSDNDFEAAVRALDKILTRNSILMTNASN